MNNNIEYVGYLNSSYGIIELIASDEYLLSLKILTKKELNEIDINYEKSNEIINTTKKQLEKYFEGELEKFDVPLFFDNSFKSRVLKSLYDTKTGDVMSYKELAEINNSKANRAVGTIMAQNKIPIIIPCHRITKSDGSVGNYYYGSKMKENLLLHEAEYLFYNKCTTKILFSKEEYKMLINHKDIKKIFDVMPPMKYYMKYNSIFSCLISQIIYQQIAYKTAKKQEILLYKMCNYVVTKEKLSKIDDKDFKKLGISGFRLKYIRNVINSNIDFESLVEYDNEKIYEILMEIKGIGTWTVEMVLLFGLGRKHVISYKDLIIINGLKKIYLLEEISFDKFNEIVSTFKGFESIVSMNLWKYVEEKYYEMLN